MSLWDDLKKKAYDANPELAAKAAQALDKARDLAVEAGQKAAPILKQASDKATVYAQEKTPILKAQALKAIDDAKLRRAQLQEQAKRDKAARAEMIRTMYDITLAPDDVNFIEEPFNHFERQLGFFVFNGEVLDSQKRNQTHLDAYHSHRTTGGTMWQGTGSTGSSSSSMQVSTHNVQEHEFWVRLENGKESCFQLNNTQVRIRPGQHVSLLFVHNAGNQNGTLVALYNHNAGKTSPSSPRRRSTRRSTSTPRRQGSSISVKSTTPATGCCRHSTCGLVNWCATWQCTATAVMGK